MKKYLLLLIGLTSAVLIHSMEDRSVIEGASYVICNSGMEVTFYTFDGEIIVTVDDSCLDMSVRLDSRAPKPQPTHCKIVYKSSRTNNYGVIKVVSESFINFYDKSGNLITQYPIDPDTRFISLSHERDANNKILIKGMFLHEALYSSQFPLDLRKVVILPEEAPASRFRKFCSIL